MNKLTLDQIGFIKHKLQQFIALPSTPSKQQPSLENTDNSQFFRSPNKSKVRQPPTRNPQGTSDSQIDNKKWLAKKQNDILQYITHENRSRDSVLNKFLNSDKIHLKKREQVDKQFQSKQTQKIPQQRNDQSENFSFDDGFSSLKKVYKNIGGFLGGTDNANYKNDNKNQNQNQQADNSQLQLIKMLKSMQSKPQINQQEKQNTKPKFLIQTQTQIIKPSALKRKFQQIQTPRISNNTLTNEKKTTFDFNHQVRKNGQEKKTNNNKIIKKNDSQISLQKRKKSPSVSNIKIANNDNQERKRSISKIEKKMTHNPSQSPSKRSFQFFDSERPSTIRPPHQMKSPRIQNRRESVQYQTPIRNHESPSPKNFPSSVYKKSFKQNPYEITNYQKFYINKYRSKQLSPDQKRNLKQKYQMLDQRLVKILSAVKNQKESAVQCFSSPQIQARQLPSKKAQIPEEILMYQKFSPLKKIIKVNKQLRMKFDPDDF